MKTTIPGPVAGTRMTGAYLAEIARFAYFWAWPMVNMHNRLLSAERIPGPGLAGGYLPVTPPNRLCMLRDYIDPFERAIACPNQDVVYGQGLLDLNKQPVVIQVPDFGDRFWVYQVVDQRTDSFAELGAMYASAPGFYLFAHADWAGQIPDGITAVFRCPTRIGAMLPRLFMDDSAADRAAIQPIVSQINAYPLSEFDGRVKTVDWAKIPQYPGDDRDTGDAEVGWVDPETFFAQLPSVLDEVPPLPGEESIYGQIRAILAAAQSDAGIAATLTAAARQSDKEIIRPLFEFRNFGLPLAHGWTHIQNGAQFGTDYFTRTAVAKSNIFVNRRNETAYFYQDLDAGGRRLHGSNRYAVTFPKGGLPPARGFWSLTVYNEHHFFHANDLERYSLGTKSKELQYNSDGSLTLHVGTQPPGRHSMANWLPAPDGNFSLFMRAYWPETGIMHGSWTPPPVAGLGPMD
ncbi:hypothetical protein A5641_02635 [Mycobacterium sp. 1554424.7]|nr:hypothetical protein A5641_02635 [Mycobacterium sp. 1554424.7]